MERVGVCAFSGQKQPLKATVCSNWAAYDGAHTYKDVYCALSEHVSIKEKEK